MNNRTLQSRLHQLSNQSRKSEREKLFSKMYADVRQGFQINCIVEDHLEAQRAYISIDPEYAFAQQMMEEYQRQIECLAEEEEQSRNFTKILVSRIEQLDTPLKRPRRSNSLGKMEEEHSSDTY